MRLELGGDRGECATRYRGGNGRNARFMPADAGIEDRRTGGLDGLGLLHDLFPVAAVFDQVDQRQAVDDDEIRAAGFADAAHDLHREAHALCGITAPAIVALVGARGDELVDEVTLRAHHFHAVVAGFAGQLRAACIVGDVPLDAAGRQGARGERIDRRLQLRRRYRQRVIGVAPGMQQLQADLRAVLVRGGGQLPVRAHFPRPGQLAAERLEPADHVRRETTSDDQADATFGALCEVGGQAREVARAVLQAGVHRAHQHPVAQLGEAQVQRGEQVGVGAFVGWRHVDTLAYGSAKGAAKRLPGQGLPRSVAPGHARPTGQLRAIAVAGQRPALPVRGRSRTSQA